MPIWPKREMFVILLQLDFAMHRVGLFTLTLALLGASSIARADQALRVTAEEVVLQEVEAPLVLTGLIEAAQAFHAGFPSGGQLLSVLVEAGQEVKAGTLLAEMDPTQAAEALAAARAQLRAAEASLLRSEQELERDRQLNKTGYVLNVVLDLAEQDLISTRALRDQAKAQVDSAEKALADTKLLAERDAIVISRNAEAGQVVAPAQSVVDLAELTGREAVFVAPSGMQMADLIGREIELTTVEAPRRSFNAKLYYVSPMIDPNTGGVVVKAQIDDSVARDLALSEAVSGSFPLPLGQVAALPAAALTRDQNGPAVWVVGEDQRVTLKPVEIRRYSSDLIYVSAGVQNGEKIVVKGANLLYPDRVVDPAPAQQ